MSKKRLFDNSLYDFATLQDSWWERSVNRGNSPATRLDQDIPCDVAIIGGGYTGLSAAYHLAKAFHIDVAVIEAGEIGWGSSGRNGGFCCMGGTMIGARAIARKFGLEQARRFYAVQREAIELVDRIARDESLDIGKSGNCEMVVAERPGHYQELAREHDFLKDVLGVSCAMISREKFAENHYDAPHQHGAIAYYPGFGLHPLKFCLGLANAAAKNGVRLYSNSEVTHWEKSPAAHGQRHRLTTQGGHQVICKRVIVACNGFMPEHLSAGLKSRILPLQSQIIVTRPLAPEELSRHNWVTQNPAINSRNVYSYFRMLPENRFLIGGRADFEGTPRGAAKTARALKRTMNGLWPNWSDVAVEYDWRGLVCFTGNLRPAVGRIDDDPSIYFAFGYHGNGVNNATWCGQALATWLATGNEPDIPTVMRGMTRRIPFPALRPHYAKAGIAWHRMKDLLDGIEGL